MGKQSLSRLAAHINGYKCFEIELSRGYDQSTFHEDLRKLYWMAGVQNQPTVFLLTDTQIVREVFLEDINNILSSGEVPNLFESDEYEKVILATRDDCAKANVGCDITRDDIFQFFTNRVRANLHVVLCMSPVGDAFRRRCRMFPSLVNCCTIDWFVKWPSEALYSVALGSLKDVSNGQQQNEDLAKICVMMHETVETASEQLYNEYRRHYYTTPSSYLELLKLYHNLLQTRADVITAKKSRLANGLHKILETNELVIVMQIELKEKAPKLEIASHEMQAMLKVLAEDNKVTDDLKTRVLQDENEAMEKAEKARIIADDANRDLDVVKPILKAAEDALKAISKNDINELKSFSSPPPLVQFVMESVCILMGVKPSWDSAKKLMTDVNFLKRLIEYDREHISEITIKKVKTYIDNKDFDPAKIERVSKVAKSVALWVIAIEKFSKVYKIVEPKIRKAREAENEKEQIMAVLKKKQAELAEVEAHMQLLKDNIAEKNREYQVIQNDVDLTTARLNRAGRLTSALVDEEHRWGDIVKDLTAELWAVPGDVLVASACVAYAGAFPTTYRQQLFQSWVNECRRYKIPSSNEFNLISVLGDPYEIRLWNMNYLPRDEISTQNGIVVTKALRWPLMIDPQEQANRWIRSLEANNNLNIIKISDPNLLRQLEMCIRQGQPMLIEDIEETIDPTLRPVLGRQTISQAGRIIIKLGDTEIDYDPNFKLYMTTKLSNPHYLPEVCVTVTLVNFLVNETGLEDQLLSEIVAIELPELEKQRIDLIVRINSDKQQLLQLEDKVLRLLFSSEGNILDDEELVQTLNESKETSAIIAERLIDTEETEAVITVTREKYRVLARRGAVLYFVVTSLAEIDPMYQYSLKYFISIFCSVIAVPQTEKLPLTERLEQLMTNEVYGLYLNVSRGLFENHKLIFAFLLAVTVQRQENIVSNVEWDFLLRGPMGSVNVKLKPDDFVLTDYAWKCCCYLENEFKCFNGLTGELNESIQIKIDDDFDEKIIATSKSATTTSSKLFDHLTMFQKLMLISAIAPEKLVQSICGYIRVILGTRFTEVSENSSLRSLYADTSNIVPLIFILSTGSDPMASFIRFTHKMKFTEKFHSISLGQGQGPTAESLIQIGRTLGHWVFLQNCHLATSWMGSLEQIVRNMTLGNLKTHHEFRLFLSSMPTKSFPISVLQNSVKVTNEPPKGLKANLVRSFNDLSADYFEQHALGINWRRMVFGVCMFHGVLLERRKFGPLGWNISYEFTESDRECGLKTLDMYCDRERQNAIPWDALEYISGEITWGGRVTDYWDQRCLKTILKIFLSEQVLDDDYAYSSTGIYKCPMDEKLEHFQMYCQNMPFDDEPEIFGMHKNANLVYQTKESKFLVKTILEGQPRQSGSGGATSTSTDDLVLIIIDDIATKLAIKITSDSTCSELFKLDDKNRVPSLTTVLLQEIERYNTLLSIVYDSLHTLRKAIQGFVVMSESLEAVFNALKNNNVPDMWSNKGFLSTKSLGYWLIDFQHRIDYIQMWISKGLPCSSWISGLFFPQSFLTGTLQTHARKHNLPIDSLKIDFQVLDTTIVQADVYAGHCQNVAEVSRF